MRKPGVSQTDRAGRRDKKTFNRRRVPQVVARFKRGSAIPKFRDSLKNSVSSRDLSRSQSKVARLLTFSLMATIILLVIVTQTIHNPEVEIKGVGNFDVDKYTTILNDYLRSNPAARFKPLLNINTLNSYIAGSAPEIEKVESIQTGLGRRTKIRVVARVPVVMWESSGKKHYVDSSGASFTTNYFADPSILVDDRSGASLPSTGRVANDRFVSFIGQVVAISSDMSLVVKRIIIPPLTTRQIELYVNDLTFPIRMSTADSASRQVSDASRSINFLQERGITPSYLDVRVERKVYYK